MKITVDIHEVWAEHEGNIDVMEALKKSIIHELVAKIKQIPEIKNMINSIRDTAIQILKDSMPEITAPIMAEIFTKQVVRGRYPDDPLRTFEQFVKDEFNAHDTFKKFSVEKIVQEAKSLGTYWAQEMKERTDLAFATAIVKKMGEQGLLNEEAVKRLTLLDNSPKES